MEWNQRLRHILTDVLVQTDAMTHAAIWEEIPLASAKAAVVVCANTYRHRRATEGGFFHQHFIELHGGGVRIREEDPEPECNDKKGRRKIRSVFGAEGSTCRRTCLLHHILTHVLDKQGRLPPRWDPSVFSFAAIAPKK